MEECREWHKHNRLKCDAILAVTDSNIKTWEMKCDRIDFEYLTFTMYLLLRSRLYAVKVLNMKDDSIIWRLCKLVGKNLHKHLDELDNKTSRCELQSKK